MTFGLILLKSMKERQIGGSSRRRFWIGSQLSEGKWPGATKRAKIWPLGDLESFAHRKRILV